MFVLRSLYILLPSLFVDPAGLSIDWEFNGIFFRPNFMLPKKKNSVKFAQNFINFVLSAANFRCFRMRSHTHRHDGGLQLAGAQQPGQLSFNRNIPAIELLRACKWANTIILERVTYCSETCGIVVWGFVIFFFIREILILCSLLLTYSSKPRVYCLSLCADSEPFVCAASHYLDIAVG